MSQANVEVVRAFFADQGDQERLARRLHPRVEWHVRPAFQDAAVYRGHSGFRKLATRFDEVLTGQQYDPLEFVDAGADVVVPLRWRAQALSGSGFLERSETWVFTIQGGLIKTVVEFATKEAALDAVRLSDQPTQRHTTARRKPSESGDGPDA